MTVSQWATEARAAAAHPEHAWDVAALDWPLTTQSVVVEVGGFKGRWALQIADRYSPRLYVFEPQPWAAGVCSAVLGERATVLPYALGVADGEQALARFGTDGASLMAGEGDPVAVREIAGAFAGLGLTKIHLMLVNVEGYEYTLIPHMLKRRIRPRWLMVQEHTAHQTVDLGATLAAAGYRVRWSYGAVLTAWERKR